MWIKTEVTEQHRTNGTLVNINNASDIVLRNSETPHEGDSSQTHKQVCATFGNNTVALTQSQPVVQAELVLERIWVAIKKNADYVDLTKVGP